MKSVLVAGATGYLGRHIVKQLISEGRRTKAIARASNKLDDIECANLEVVEAEVTQPATLKGTMEEVDTVISTVGITRQKDGLTYEQVDYQANMNLLEAAQQDGVRKFIFVSVLNGQHLKELQICKAKERFVEALQASGMDYTVIRPNGFFSDMKEFLEMARKGRIYLFGSGEKKSNPIHGSDLAKLCTGAIDSDQREVEVGGPDTYSQSEIAELAFDAINKPVSVTKIPDVFRRIALAVLRIFSPVSVYGPLEFFLTVLSMDMLAPELGEKRLADFFKDSVQGHSSHNTLEGECTSEANSHDQI